MLSQNRIVLLICCLQCLSFDLCAANICDKQMVLAKRRFSYWPTRQCQRSNQTQVDQANFASAKQCADLARERQALAFNFAWPRRGTRNRYDKGANKVSISVHIAFFSVV